jgi:hypothetical protein
LLIDDEIEIEAEDYVGDGSSSVVMGKSSSPHPHLILVIITSSSPHPHLILT